MFLLKIIENSEKNMKKANLVCLHFSFCTENISLIVV